MTPNEQTAISDYGLAIPIGEHGQKLEFGTDAIVCSTDCDDGDLRLMFISGGMSFQIDMTVDKLQRLRDLLNVAIAEAFEVQPGLRCPCCGYTKDEAEASGDHRNCRRYPFFPGESGRSYAV